MTEEITAEMAAVEMIDDALKTMCRARLVEASRVSDLLLDVRRLLGAGLTP